MQDWARFLFALICTVYLTFMGYLIVGVERCGHRGRGRAGGAAWQQGEAMPRVTSKPCVFPRSRRSARWWAKSTSFLKTRARLVCARPADMMEVHL